jgi:hypothetical protein
MKAEKTTKKRKPGRPKKYEHYYSINVVLHDKKLIDKIVAEEKTKTLTDIITDRLLMTY